MEDQLEGRASTWSELDAAHAVRGCHVGYGVISVLRRRGDVTVILREALSFAPREGEFLVRFTSTDDNVGSATVIEWCGGVLESVSSHENGVTLRRYWISSDGASPRGQWCFDDDTPTTGSVVADTGRGRLSAIRDRKSSPRARGR